MALYIARKDLIRNDPNSYRCFVEMYKHEFYKLSKFLINLIACLRTA